SDGAVSDVCHQDVTCDTLIPTVFPGEHSWFLHTDSQDNYSVSQLLQLASNKKPGPVVDSTQTDVFSGECEEGLVKQDDMLVVEENISNVKLDEQRAAQVEDVVSTFD
nr:hypothetical protein [Tanacetum cinerariifolium]